MHIKNYFVTFCDAAEPWQYGIQDPATPNMEGMIFFHNYLVFFIWFIAFAVFWLLYKIIADFNDGVRYNSITFTHSSVLEVIWTIVPAVTLVILAIPSFALLYSLDELIDPSVTLKIVGHQWYWSYEFSDIGLLKDTATLNFDSYMRTTDSLNKGAFRLLETDNRVGLPTNTHLRILVTAADVLHSWAVPSLGIKVDACPGRLSQASLFIKREGVYYGQCSEICGVNHGFMPIVLRAIKSYTFTEWVNWKLGSG